jgi:hypothetical protein
MPSGMFRQYREGALARGRMRPNIPGLEQVMSPFEQAAGRWLYCIPGIDRRSAQNIVAEIGTDLKGFASADHLAS